MAKKKLNEGVLDAHDDDGFMAKRQLYDLAKYATMLHKMINDEDDLEPWVQAKITKAADYIDTVKHYMEYRDVRDADDMADEVGIDIQDPAEPALPPEPEMAVEPAPSFESTRRKTPKDAREIYERMLKDLK